MTHKGTGYKKWVVLACCSHGLTFGFLYAFQQCFHDSFIELKCSWSVSYNLTYKAFFSSWIVMCLSLLIILNGSIICSSRRNRNTQFNLNADRSSEHFQTRYQQELKLTNTIRLVIVCFVICWSPLSVLYSGQAITRKYHFYDAVFDDILPDSNWPDLGRFFNNFSYLITGLNSLCDPLIFAFRMKDINEAIRDIFVPTPIQVIEPERTKMTTIVHNSSSIKS
jgi:7 transmembrane receptor (rhodopsin family)